MRTKLMYKDGTVWCHTYWLEDPWYNQGAYKWQRDDHRSTCSTMDKSDRVYEQYRELSFGPNDFFDICPEEFPF